MKRSVLRSQPLTDVVVRMARPVTKPRRKSEVVLFHAGRCGSTVLGDLLGQHPRIAWGGEIFRKHWSRGEKSDEAAICRFVNAHRYTTPAPIYGFEITRQQLSRQFLNMELPQLFAMLKSLEFSRFILLERKNLLRRYISMERAKLSRQWHARVSKERPTPVHLSFENVGGPNKRMSLTEHFKSIEQFNSDLVTLLSGENHISLTYEDDIFADPMIAYRKICDWLGIREELPRVTLHKSGDYPYDSLVENVEDAVKALRGTKYSWMLDDASMTRESGST